MPALDQRTEQALFAYAGEVRAALGETCVGVVLYGSAVGLDFVPGRSDLNTVIVLRQASVAALDVLAPVLARWRGKGFALPVVLDAAQVEQAQVLFPMELDDIKRQHRLLAGVDPFADVHTDDAALRRECAQDAFGKLLRLRAFYLDHGTDAAALTRMMAESVKSFLIAVKHLSRLRGAATPESFAATLDAGESAVGPLPAMRWALAQRQGDPPPDAAQIRARAAAYVAEAERVTAAVTAFCV